MIGMQTFMGITENHLTAFKHEKGGLLEYILSPSNLNLAYKRVKNNKGSGGIDRMEVDDLLPYLLCHKDKLIASIYDGKYHPNRSAHDALLKCGEYISAGYVFTVDMDFEKFFDTVCHSKLIEFVRYADDLVIFCKSRRSTQRTLDNLVPFIETKLFLKVNKEKTRVAYMRDIKFLSYAFCRRKYWRMASHPTVLAAA